MSTRLMKAQEDLMNKDLLNEKKAGDAGFKTDEEQKATEEAIKTEEKRQEELAQTQPKTTIKDYNHMTKEEKAKYKQQLKEHTAQEQNTSPVLPEEEKPKNKLQAYLNLTPHEYQSNPEYKVKEFIDLMKAHKYSDEDILENINKKYEGNLSDLAKYELKKVGINVDGGKKEDKATPITSTQSTDATTPSSGESGKTTPTPTTAPKVDPTPKYKGNSNLEFLDEERAKLSDMTTDQLEETEKLKDKYNDIAERIDPHYIENLPRSIIQSFYEDKFGMHKIDPELEEQYKKLKGKENLTADEQKVIQRYKDQKAERSKARGTLGYFLADKIATGLMNAGAIAQGQQGGATSEYDKVLSSKLGGALERYNKKYEDMANNDMSLIYNDALASQEINNQLKKVYADKTVQPYLQRLDLDNRSKFVNYVAAMGDKLPWEQLPDLLKGLLVYQDTGNLPQTAFNMLEKAGNFLTNLLPWK